MRESDIIRLADVLAHITDRDAIITVLRLAEDLDGQTLQRLAQAALRERDEAWAERDEALARVAELEAECARLRDTSTSNVEPRSDMPVHCERCGWEGTDRETVGDATRNCPDCGSTWEVTEGPKPAGGSDD